jgi:hypothetical protein
MADITQEVRDKLAQAHIDSYERRHAEAIQRQREIAKHNQDRRSVNGMGRPVMEVDNKVYQEWTKREGKEIWKDPDFRKYMARNNPELRVKSGGTGKTQVGYGS